MLYLPYSANQWYVVSTIQVVYEHEPMHLQFGHLGDKAMQELHKDVDDVPPLKGHIFFRCPSSLHSKAKQHTYNNSTPNITRQQPLVKGTTIHTPENRQHIFMDYGFIWGIGFSSKDEDGRTLTSINGYCSYHLIIECPCKQNLG
jgi:hypothetical protein